MEDERSDLQELLHALRSRSEAEATEIFRRLRLESDPSATLNLIRDGDLLLQTFPGQPNDDGREDNATHRSQLGHRVTAPAADAGHLAVSQGQPGSGATKSTTESETVGSMTLERKHDVSSSDVDRIRGLLYYIHALPEAHVASIVQRIRSSHDPLSVLQFLEHGDPKFQQVLADSQNQINDARLGALDAAALRSSRIKVPARPWTIVAADGIVSHLISTFFELEQTFLMPFVDEEAFLAEMASGDATKARACSPLLVNAMCAMTAVGLPLTRLMLRVSHVFCSVYIKLRQSIRCDPSR